MVDKLTSRSLLPRIESRIHIVRNVGVMIDADLAELYGVPTKALNQAVKRNAGRFPTDFMFQLNPVEKLKVVTNCDHLNKLKFSKALPFAFTEFGAIALEDKTDRLYLSQDTFGRNTRAQLKQVFDALRELAKKSAPDSVEPPTPSPLNSPLGL
jgi:ORF6N domain